MRRWSPIVPLFLGIVVAAIVHQIARAESSFADVISQVQPKIVKIYGAGGLRRLESYQSGFLISGEGHVLTAWSYVLDTDYVTVTLDDGRRFQGELLGSDPRLEIAVLKIDTDQLSFFALRNAVELSWGGRVLAFSNLFGVAVGHEAASVLHGSVAAKTRLTARRGAFDVRYRGPVYVLDAMTNNPGAAGGALTDRRGRLVGVLGKELRDAQTNTWLNYALPISEMASAVEDIIAGRHRVGGADLQEVLPDDPWTLPTLGVVLVPNILEKTPPFIQRVLPDSPAARAGLQPDDLVIFLADDVMNSSRSLVDELRRTDRSDPLRLVVLRDQELRELILQP